MFNYRLPRPIREISTDWNFQILILNAHEGAGVVALQLANILRPARDLWITAQCPLDVTDGTELCRTNGARETIRRDVYSTLFALPESSFDAVIDTKGGSRIYDASRRVIRQDGIFVTMIGDELAVPTPKAMWKNNMRFLGRALFSANDSKAIAYWCSAYYDQREDVRDALERLCGLVESSELRPMVKRVWSLQEGGEAFVADGEEGFVVRVVGT
jgi:NADPH:quinone reductase-like Zn-dependent oxidoreductase